MSSQLANIAAEAGAYQSAAEAIGLKVKLKSVSAPNYINFFTDPKARAGRRRLHHHQLRRLRRPGRAAVARSSLPGGSQNYDDYQQPEDDVACSSRPAAPPTPDKRAAAGRAGARSSAAKQLPWIPNVQPTTVLIMSKNLTGAPASFPYMFAPVGGQPRRDRLSGGGDARRFLARRLAMLVASLLVASFVIFAALYLAPGNPIAALSGGRALPPDAIAVLEQRYHLNDPFLVQYWHWLSGALHGDLGDLDPAAARTCRP